MEKRIKFNIDMPDEIRLLQKLFKAKGFKLFLVGGADRDAFLGQNPKDFDLATDALPDIVEEILRSNNVKTLATGKQFGVINAFTQHNEFEIATFRTDVGSGRRPEGVIFTTIDGDVKRRDLTINALFYDIETSEIVDLVGGLNDLSEGIVRTVGPAEDRFDEDRLRILRAIRFAARFGSDLDEDIKKALNKNSSLDGVSSERIRDEFIKGIKSAKSVRHFIKMLFDFNLMSEIFTNVLFLNTSVGFTKDKIIVLAQLLKDNSIDTLKEILNKLTFTTDEIKGVVFLTRIINAQFEDIISLKKEQKISGLTKEQIREFARLIGLDGVSIDLFLEFELSVSGTQVMEMTGATSGPELGKLINEMEIANFKKLIEE